MVGPNGVASKFNISVYRLVAGSTYSTPNVAKIVRNSWITCNSAVKDHLHFNLLVTSASFPCPVCVRSADAFSFKPYFSFDRDPKKQEGIFVTANLQ